MENKFITFEQTYSGEELCDIERDVMESFDHNFNPKMNNIPVDEYNLHKGTFWVKIEWIPE